MNMKWITQVIKIHGHVTLQLIMGLIQGQLMCPKLVPKYWWGKPILGWYQEEPTQTPIEELPLNVKILENSQNLRIRNLKN
jgi:hypothetical protein